MINPYRAEVVLTINDEPVVLKMNLGALAALEATCGAKNLSELVGRFATNEPKTQDLIKVLNAGLYGCGRSADIERCEIKGGAVAAAAAAATLLANAFPPEALNAV